MGDVVQHRTIGDACIKGKLGQRSFPLFTGLP
jgi:hypothetical protein